MLFFVRNRVLTSQISVCVRSRDTPTRDGATCEREAQGTQTSGLSIFGKILVWHPVESGGEFTKNSSACSTHESKLSLILASYSNPTIAPGVNPELAAIEIKLYFLLLFLHVY